MKARLLAAFTLAILLFVPANVAKILVIQAPGLPFRFAINAAIAAAALVALRQVWRGRLEFAGNALVLGTLIPVLTVAFSKVEYAQPMAGAVQLLGFSVVYLLVAVIFASRPVAFAGLVIVGISQVAFHQLAFDQPDASAATILRDGLITTAFIFGLGLILTRIVEVSQARSTEAQRRSRETANDLERLVVERTRELEAATLAATLASGAKSDFLANVSHEIRTPLNGIVASTDLLLREPGLPPAAITYAHLIAESGSLLSHLIGDVLDFSKIEADRLELEIQPLTLRRVIDDVATLASTRAEGDRASLRVQIQPTLPEHHLGDELRLRQILLNLISNALKFTPDDGTVDLVVSAPDPAGDPTPLRFEVRDTGIGMDEPTRARVFERFTQADNSTTRRYGGTGLGLAISARLVKMMGGQLEVVSAVAKGSTFSFTVSLPVSPVGPAGINQPLPLSSALGLRVLVAEDNPINQKILASQLAKLGCSCVLAANGEDALAALDQAPLPDVILMDCHMPGLDGWEATTRIRSDIQPDTDPERAACRRSLPIIALTAVARSEDRARCFASGMSGFLSKPIQLAELHLALEPFANPREPAA